MGPFGIQEILFISFFLLIVLGGTIFWVLAIVDCATKESSEGNTKIVWIIIIVFTHVIGAAIYWLVRRPKRLVELGR